MTGGGSTTSAYIPPPSARCAGLGGMSRGGGRGVKVGGAEWTEECWWWPWNAVGLSVSELKKFKKLIREHKVSRNE